MSHWRSVDYRIGSLNNTITGFEQLILELRKKIDDVEWYDGLSFLEEAEPIYGLAFIAIQNYVNSSIYDRYDTLEKQHLKYKLGKKIGNTGRTDIELVVSMANYFKHRDHPHNLIGETFKILNDFNLKFDKEVEVVNSPIFKGLEILSENWELDVVVKSVSVWREKLWIIE